MTQGTTKGIPIDTDASLSADSDQLVPSQKAVKAYADAISAGSGSVNGPGSSTDNAVVRWDTTTGNLIQNSTVIVDDSGNMTGVSIDANGAGNAITNIDVADLANGTDGELITWDAAGAPTTVAVGSSGQTLTSNGAGAAPTFQNHGAKTECVRAYASGGQTLTTATFTKVQLNTEDFDVAGTFDSATNYRWTPTTAGKYIVSASVFFNINASGIQIAAYIYKNGASNTYAFDVTASTSGQHVSSTAILDMNGSTDYIELYAIHYKGSDGDIAASSYIHGALLF